LPSDNTKIKYQELLESITDIKKKLMSEKSDDIEKYHDVHKSIIADLKTLKPEPDPDLEIMIKEILKELETTCQLINKQQSATIERFNTEAKRKTITDAYVKE